MKKNYKYKVIRTADGSDSVALENAAETFHSQFGALTESVHIFINAGLKEAQKVYRRVNILEVGFGTGLNALLTLRYSAENDLEVCYKAIEPYPLPPDIYMQLNYPQLTGCDETTFIRLHQGAVNKETRFSEKFSLSLTNETVQSIIMPEDFYHLVFFDAFNPDLEPDMWQADVFGRLYQAMKKNSILVTYSAKGSVRRAMTYTGFQVEKLPGPPGKRDITRAFKR